MNLNEIWNTFQAIYEKTASVFFVLIIVLPLIISCFPKGSFKKLWNRFSAKLLALNNEPGKVSTFSQLLNKFKLNVLTPIVFIIASIWLFVMISDVFNAVANYTSFGPPNKDLFIERKSPDDLVVFSIMYVMSLDSTKIDNTIMRTYVNDTSNLVLAKLKNFQNQMNPKSDCRNNALSSIYKYYEKAYFGLKYKNPLYESFIGQYELNVNKHRTRFGGFFLSAIFMIILLVRPISRIKYLDVLDNISYFWFDMCFLITCLILFVLCPHSWVLWFLNIFMMLIILLHKNQTIRDAKIKWWRAFFIFLIIVALAIRYRLHYEWAYENETIVKSGITALAIQQEKNIDIDYVSKSLKDSLKSWQYEYRPEKFWFARWYDSITKKYIDSTIISYRPVNDTLSLR